MIIGSFAIKHYFPEFPREPKDYDIVAFDEYDKLDLVRIHKGTPNLKLEVLINPIILNHFKENGGIPSICTPNELYTLKMSHVIGWKLENGSWDKHLWDIQWLKSKGCILNRPLFDKLYKYWETIHGPNNRSNLDLSSEDFFDNAIEFPIKHDDLHLLLIEHPFFNKQDKPTYTKILIGEVDVSMDKFKELSEEEKYNIVIEEVMVMATERWPKLGYLHAFHRMLKKFVREHAKIEEAIWILENWQKLHKAPFNFIEFLNEKINEKSNNYIR